MEYAKRILAAHDEAVGRLTTPGVTGRLRIGLIDYCLPELLPGLLIQFRRRYPNIHLDLQIDVGINLIPLFDKGELDIVVAGKDDHQGKFKGLNCKVLVEEPLVWVTGADADDSQHETIPLVLFPQPCNFRKLSTETLDNSGRKWEILLTGNSSGSIQTAVQAGMGLSVLPMGALKKGLKQASSKLSLPELPMFAIALFSNENKKNKARDVFVSYIEAALENHSSSSK